MRQFNTPQFFGSYRPSNDFCTSKGTSVHDIGTFHLELGNGRILKVNELHYETSAGTGLEIIPVVDRAGDAGSGFYDTYPVTKTLGQSEIKGSELLDSILRKEYGVGEDSPVLALLTYQHFENTTGTLNDLGNPSFLKAENSQTHSALYIGKGKTRNSPYNYHGKRLQVKGYPANVYIVKPTHVDMETFLQNFDIASRLINEANDGVEFPENYKLDNYHLTSLDEVLDHFRGWIDKNWVNKKYSSEIPFNELLKKQNVFALYCAEYTTFSLNLALNLPFNEKGFTEAFGHAGKELWKVTKQTWYSLTGEEIPTVKDFIPLNQLAFKPQNTADLISCFLQMYAPWPQVGVGLSAVVCYGFIPEVKHRTGLEEAEFVHLFQESIAMMAFYKSLTGADISKTIDEICFSLSSLPSEEVKKLKSHIEAKITSDYMKAKKDELLNGGFLSEELAYNLYLKEMNELRSKAEQVQPLNSFSEQLTGSLSQRNIKTTVNLYSPPAVFHRIAIGIYPCNESITIKAICTIMDVSDVVRAGEEAVNSQVTAETETWGTK